MQSKFMKTALHNKNRGTNIILLLVTVTVVLTLVLSDGYLTNHEDLADKLIREVRYEGEFNFADPGLTQEYYPLSRYADASFHCIDRSGLHADELAVFAMKTTDEAYQLFQAAKEHVTAQTAAHPDEADKLTGAVVWIFDRYVVVCVTDDTEPAKEVLRSYTPYFEFES